ncbi:hypothetical protein JVT61DRAFT_9799 [Boletus reticuloceps]|uniref:CHAT domain-containing protein n=1 Tax=Boletus reticuloceps TaxID=495285 RepID=A0A8I2YG06_9AGAM|nr:hypothetical protein JVT61DRAFT_9799 [Boletus reticuloceps]
MGPWQLGILLGAVVEGHRQTSSRRIGFLNSRLIYSFVSRQSPGDISRIFWCPTGPFVFLPIHAVGFYDPQYSLPGRKVFDFVVSSYVPTRSPNLHAVPNDDLRLLAVRQPPSDGLGQLPGVAPEIAYIKEAIRDSPSAHTTILESSLGTVGLMKEANWVHFACHGIQDGVDFALLINAA